MKNGSSIYIHISSKDKILDPSLNKYPNGFETASRYDFTKWLTRCGNACLAKTCIVVLSLGDLNKIMYLVLRDIVREHFLCC